LGWGGGVSGGGGDGQQEEQIAAPFAEGDQQQEAGQGDPQDPCGEGEGIADDGQPGEQQPPGAMTGKTLPGRIEGGWGEGKPASVLMMQQGAPQKPVEHRSGDIAQGGGGPQYEKGVLVAGCKEGEHEFGGEGQQGCRQEGVEA